MKSETMLTTKDRELLQRQLDYIRIVLDRPTLQCKHCGRMYPMAQNHWGVYCSRGCIEIATVNRRNP